MKNGLEKRQSNSQSEPPIGWGQTMRNIGFVLLAVLLSWIMSGVFFLKENQYAIVSKLGRFHSVRGAGLHWVMPFPFSQYHIVPFAAKGSLTVGSVRAPAGGGLANSVLLSADGKPFNMQVQLQYRVSDVKQYLTTQAVEVEPFLQYAAAAVMRQFAAKNTWQNLRTMPSAQWTYSIQTALQKQLNKLSMGIIIAKVVAKSNAIRPTEAIQKEYASLAELEQKLAQEKTDLQTVDNLERTRTKVKKIRSAAHDYKAKTIAQAQENSARFTTILPQYQYNPQAARTYLRNQTMQRIFEKTNKVIVDSSVDNPVHVTVAASTSADQPQSAPKATKQKSAAKVKPNTAFEADTIDVFRSRTRDPDVLRQRVGVEQ